MYQWGFYVRYTKLGSLYSNKVNMTETPLQYNFSDADMTIMKTQIVITELNGPFALTNLFRSC